jgi:hypothetical protein
LPGLKAGSMSGEAIANYLPALATLPRLAPLADLDLSDERSPAESH